ncbi:MAG: pyridoxal phosphate-dependent aminotransferase [Synergistaceae bacterium]|nr:pyridoxal phosphate-dependent aminotransferase [Synergistaceae bacterium]
MGSTSKYDFNSPINRRGTNSSKWDGAVKVFGKEGLLPFWVADMDFRSAPEIIESLRKKVEFGVFGYPIMTDEAKKSVADWERTRHGWDVDFKHVSFMPGVVAGLSVAVQTFTAPGDGIIIQTPVYPPFFQVIKDNGRVVVENPLKETDLRFEMDFENLERVITENKNVKALILCSPHNPVARVWDRYELERLASVCLRHDIMVINDEIHQDLIYSDAKHTPLAVAAKELSPLLVTLVAPSKTFNIAGLSASAWIAEDPKVAERLSRSFATLHIGSINLLAIAALEEAYKNGAPWLESALKYLEGNRSFLEDFLNNKLPRVKMKHPEGTFIFWLDFRDYGFHNDELQRILVKEAGVALNPGTNFGANGDGFARLNIGCSRSQLEEGLERVERTFAKL